MKKALKAGSLLLYFDFSLIFYEIVLKLSLSQASSWDSFFYILLFNMSFSILFFLVASLFNGKDRFVLAFILLFLSGAVFASQMIYYRFFKTFYTVFSAFKGGKAFEFWKDILYILSKNWVWLVLFFLPSILALILKNRLLFCQRPKIGSFVLLLLLLVVFQGIATAGIYLGDRGPNSPYNLYFNPGNPLISAEKLGLLTAMRLDAQRFIFGDTFSIVPVHSHDEASQPIAEESIVKPVNPDKPLQPKDEEEKDNEKENDGDNEQVDQVEEEIVPEPNILDIDFAKLIEDEENEKIKDMHGYFSSLTPTYKNEYTENIRDIILS